jgi:hypothetical protein
MARRIRGSLVGVTALFAALAASAATVDVHVTVHTGLTQPPMAYIALVAPDCPMWRPTAEAIAPFGSTTFHVSPGSYTAYVGAAGYQDQLRTIRVTTARELRIDLEPSVPVSGIVVDSKGQPVRGAPVRQARLAAPRPFSQISDMARSYFAAQWTTWTDDTGRWSLPGYGNGSIPIIIEVAGLSPGFLSAATSRDVASTVLRNGSSLRVDVERVDPELFVSLVADAPHSCEIPQEWQPRVWAKAADSNVLEWPSLPAGTYHVVARYPDPRRFSRTAVVATVSLVENQSSSARVTLPPPVRPDPNVLAFFVADKTTTELLELRSSVTRSAAGDTDDVEHSLQAASGGTVVYLRTGASPSDLLLVTPADVIAAKQGEMSSNESVETVISPRAEATLRLRSGSDETPLPRWAMARFDSCTFGDRISFAASISPEGSLKLPFPTACHSLALQLSPFGPVIMDVELRPGETRSLGEFALELGGGVDVHVVHDPGGAAATNASVRATTARTGQPLIIAEGLANRDGKLLLQGLPTNGDILIEARDPETSLSGSVSVRLDPGKVATVDPVAIPVPAKLVVAPRLASDFRDRFPGARIRLITLDRDDASAADSRRTSELTSDEVVFERLHPGKWHPTALVEAAETLQPVPLEDVSLRSGEERRLTALVQPAVFEGTVTSGGKGIAAMIGFAEEPSPTSVTRFARSKEDGRFTILLPFAGIYGVQVTPFDRRDSRIDLGELELSDPLRALHLQLPDGVLLVRVKRHDRPLAKATVTALLRRSSLRGGVAEIVTTRPTNANGEATVDPLPEGKWVVEARDLESGERAQQSVDLVRNDAATVELQLAGTAVLGGFVHDPKGLAVPEARVDCLFLGAGNLPQTTRAETDLTGHFTIDLAAPFPATLHCGVATPAGAIAAYDTPPTGSADFVLPADAASLTLADWGRKLVRDVYWLVADDGRLFSLSWAAGRFGQLWSPLNIPRVPAGSWKIVRVETLDQWIRLGTAGGNAISPMVELQLEPGEKKTIQLYQSRPGNRP